MHYRFPILFYPAFQAQEELRRKFMGVDWWEIKLRKYRSLRSNLSTELLSTDKIARKEQMARERVENKIRRKALRKQKIRASKSSVHRNLLKAQQMADSISLFDSLW